MTRDLELWQLDCRKYDVTELKSLGGFKNVRSDYDWEGFKLELDETKFDWGTVYEIEVETVRSSSSPCISVCYPAILFACDCLRNACSTLCWALRHAQSWCWFACLSSTGKATLRMVA